MDERERHASYVREKLNLAAHAIRDGDKPVQERVLMAHRVGLSAVDRTWIPHADARDEFDAINAALTRHGPGSVSTTLWTMSDNDANSLADRIVALADRYLA